MKTKKEWENILKAEIILEARKLLSTTAEDDFMKTLEAFDRLYPKLAAYKYLKENEELDRFFEHEQFSSAEPRTADPAPPKSPLSSSPTPTKPPKQSASTFQQKTRMRFKPKQKTIPPLKIGLADKIAFVQHLFNGNQEFFEKFLNEINEAPTYEDALEIVQRHKQNFSWEGKDEYEFRLLQLIHAKYAL